MLRDVDYFEIARDNAAYAAAHNGIIALVSLYIFHWLAARLLISGVDFPAHLLNLAALIFLF